VLQYISVFLSAGIDRSMGAHLRLTHRLDIDLPLKLTIPQTKVARDLCLAIVT